MQGESAFKIGSILLLIGFAVGGAQMTAQAEAVTSLEAQALAPGVQDTHSASSISGEISVEELAATLQPETKASADSTSDSLMRALGYGGLRDDAEAAASVEQMNAGHFRPFQAGAN